MKTITIIFLHGFLGEPDDWQPVIEHLPNDWHCLSLDLNASDPLSHAKMQLDLQDSPFFLVGYSMGGRVAWQLAPHLPCLQGLILLGAHPGLHSEEEKTAREEENRKWISLLENGDMAGFLKQWYNQPLFSSLRKKEEIIAKRMGRDPQLLAKMMRATSLSRQPRLSVTGPTLFLHGAEDLKYAALYSGQLHVEAIPEAGHAAHIENPQALANAIQRFVESYYDHD